jgi:hypothetical protein
MVSAFENQRRVVLIPDSTGVSPVNPLNHKRR